MAARARATPALDAEVMILGNQAGRNNTDRNPELGGGNRDGDQQGDGRAGLVE